MSDPGEPTPPTTLMRDDLRPGVPVRAEITWSDPEIAVDPPSLNPPEIELVARHHAATHVGLQSRRNEDSYAIAPQPDGSLLLVVCDGMGGMGRGDQASALATKELLAGFAAADGPVPERLDRAIGQADARVRRELCSDGRGWAGTTAVLVHIDGDQAHVAWVGDSRAYLVRRGTVIERTRDHKLLQELVDQGQLTPEEARRSTLSSVITRSLGGRPTSAPPVVASHLGPWRLEVGDKIVGCTDGLCDLVTDGELPGLIADRSLKYAADTLIRTALDRGGHDNVTVVLATFDHPNAAPPPEVERTPTLQVEYYSHEPLEPAWLVAPALVGLISWALLSLI